ncbi:hypothetical protein LTR66_000028 [Elasticomyces elasticus]|nr:hypothetical protein LTR66_000028 [Elasticomyces elasticus]KAK5009338.1 hypothetical protein LTR28_001532 [Elasticomyces elasticus]
MHAAKISSINDWRDKSALVVGGGPIGLAMILILRSLGAPKIYVSEPSETRQKQASNLADRVIDPTKEKVGDVVRDLTDGVGADVAFDCAGVKPAMWDGMDALRRAGVYVNIAIWEAHFEPNVKNLIFKELKIIGSMTYNDEDFRDTVEMFSQGEYARKFIGLDDMVTSRILLEDLVKDGFEELVNQKDRHVKIMVTPKRELLSA